MKVGDKLYCKKTLRTQLTDYFIEDKTYSIEDVFDFNIFLKSEEDVVRFNLNPQNEDNFKIKDYFYSKNDYRKLKLLKLNEKR